MTLHLQGTQFRWERFSPETTEATKKSHDIFQVLKERTVSPHSWESHNPDTLENILQERQGTGTFSEQGEMRDFLQQTFPERTALRTSLTPQRSMKFREEEEHREQSPGTPSSLPSPEFSGHAWQLERMWWRSWRASKHTEGIFQTVIVNRGTSHEGRYGLCILELAKWRHQHPVISLVCTLWDLGRPLRRLPRATLKNTIGTSQWTSKKC